MTYPTKMRQRAIYLMFSWGVGQIPLIAEILGMCTSTLWKWQAAFVENGQTEPDRTRRRKLAHRLEEPLHVELAKRLYLRWPMAFPHEIAHAVNQQFPGCHYNGRQVWHCMRANNITRKVLEYRAKEQSEPLRHIFKAVLSQFTASQLCFLDETHTASKDLRRKHGYGGRGAPAFVYQLSSPFFSL